MARKEVSIIREKDSWKVSPGELTATKGDTICWKAVNTDAVLLVPKKNLFEQRDFETQDGTLELPVKGSKGEYPYAVFCMGPPAGFAEGNSPPVIIVDP